MCPRRKKESWRMLVVPKPLFIGKRQALHKYRGRKLWVIREYPCFTEDSMVKVYLFNQKPVMNGFFRKAIRFMFRLLGSATITYLFTLWIIELAFLERGYAACGGEFLFIPVVFYFMCKLFKL